jgi:hypothetical protein
MTKGMDLLIGLKAYEIPWRDETHLHLGVNGLMGKAVVFWRKICLPKSIEHM